LTPSRDDDETHARRVSLRWGFVLGFGAAMLVGSVALGLAGIDGELPISLAVIGGALVIAQGTAGTVA
jgi:hypothetical protein